MADPVTFIIYCPSCVSQYWQIIYYYNPNGIPTWEFVGDGGGGPGNSTPPDCPGVPVSRSQDIIDPCQPGWVPDPNGGGGNTTSNFPDNPCEVVDSLLKTTSFLQHLNMLRDSTPVHHEQGISFTLPDSSNSSHVYYNGQGTLAVTINPGIAVDGIMHNHYDTTARLSIFSVDDIIGLAQNLVRSEVRDIRTFTYTLVTDSTSYIIMIEDSTKFMNFINSWLNTGRRMELFRNYMYITNHLGDEGLTFAQNEKNFLTTLKNAMSYLSQDGIGLKLFRGSSDMTIFSPVKLNSNGQVRPDPCQ